MTRGGLRPDRTPTPRDDDRHRRGWTRSRPPGPHATALPDDSPVLREELSARVHLVSVTNGLGMSTAFAIAEETMAALD